MKGVPFSTNSVTLLMFLWNPLGKVGCVLSSMHSYGKVEVLYHVLTMRGWFEVKLSFRHFLVHQLIDTLRWHIG